MRSGIVYYRDRIAGRLLETDDGYEFTYLPEYLNDSSVPSVSLAPVRVREDELHQVSGLAFTIARNYRNDLVLSQCWG